MSGFKRRRAIFALIEAMGGEEGLLGAIMEGKSLASICREWGVSRGMTYMWLHRDEERWRAFGDARKLGAYAMADDVQEIGNRMGVDSVTVDRERVRILQWLAERANSAAFGRVAPDVKVGVVITAAELHLQAHEQLNALPVGECTSLEDMMV